jgi:hypothetical protein
MTTIRVLCEPINCPYGPICDYYNANKPADWMPISELRRAEGGFEIELTPNEKKCSLDWNKRMGFLSNNNDEIRQLRWNGNGVLKTNSSIGFTEEQTELLFKSLQRLNYSFF